MTTIDHVARLLFESPHTVEELVKATGHSMRAVIVALHYLNDRQRYRLCSRALPTEKTKRGVPMRQYWLASNDGQELR